MDAFRRPELCLSAEMGRAVASSSQCTDRIDRATGGQARIKSKLCSIGGFIYTLYRIKAAGFALLAWPDFVWTPTTVRQLLHLSGTVRLAICIAQALSHDHFFERIML